MILKFPPKVDMERSPEDIEELKELLFKIQANSDNFDSAINDLFKESVKKNHFETVKMLVDNFTPTDFEGLDQDGSSLLMVAASNGDIRMMELLVKHGADINHYDAIGFNALYHAMRRKDIEASKWLVDAGCSDNFSINDNVGKYHMPTMMAIMAYIEAKKEIGELDKAIETENKLEIDFSF